MDIWQVKNIKVKDLFPNKKNPRKISKENLKKLKSKIERLGFHNPVKVDEKMNLLGGNQRVKALLEMGAAELEIPVMIPNRPLTKKEKDEIIITDNVSDGEWDWDLLKNEWNMEELKDWGLEWDLTNDEPEEKEVVEDEVPEEVSTRCKLGDIWLLGNHRLMCGDSTNIDDVEKLMNGVKADMVFTDPPYGMKKEKDGILNDNLNYDDLLEFNRQWIPITFANLKDNGSWYCWGTDEPLMDIYSNIIKPLIKKQKATFRNLITWSKGNGQGQMSQDFRMYPIADEKCLFVMCGVQGFNNNADNYFEGWEPIRKYLNDEMEKCGGSRNWKVALGNQMGKHYFTKSQWNFPTEENYEKLREFAKIYGKDAFKREYDDIKREYDDIKREYDDIKREYYSTRAYFDNTHDNMNNVWCFERTSQQERELTGGHATPKPIALCARAIKTSSRENEIVLDVFGGSGSTLIACEQLNRKCHMMELDEHYCDVIIQRWEKLTGNKAVKL